ncbi:TniQ protein [Pseudidiomarina planktonica]|uniref:TniQ protein n=1 Tax=Pseudidiomarina planktonica TaxID=1323738 RepID=A0A1Y6E9Z1_9GAMM|nr:TniQ protein [Pseudidiomarina planktonica]
MVYTNGRAAGNSVVRGPWPARLKPLDDESLSSWLVRASLANRSTPSQIVNHVWPKWRAWTRDVDRGLDVSQTNALTQISTLHPEVIKQMLLAPIVQKITGKDSLSNSIAWKWVVQRSTRSVNTNRSTQFCPECLRTDHKPYLRLKWRLSFITICTKHQVELLDCCPQCGESVEIHKLKRGKLKYCAHCRWDISDTDTVNCNPGILILTEQLISELRNKEKAESKFELLRFTIALLRRLTDSKYAITDPLLLSLAAQTDECRLSDIRRLSFDWLNSDDRRNLLTMTAPLIELPPKELASVLLNSGIPIGRLRSFVPHLPKSLEQHFPRRETKSCRLNKTSPKSSLKPTPKRLVQRRWETFLKKHGLS